MKRSFLILMACLTGIFLSGCRDPDTSERTERYIMPKDLADKGCKIYRMAGSNRDSTLNVVYCPGAQVSTQTYSNKTNYFTSTIDEGGDHDQ